MSIERTAVGFVGPQLPSPEKQYTSEVEDTLEKVVREMVRNEIDLDHDIVVKATNRLCIPVLEEAINYRHGIFRLHVILPTSLPMFDSYLATAGKNNYMIPEDVERLRALLKRAEVRHKPALVENNRLLVDTVALDGMDNEFLGSIDRMEFVAVGMQVPGETGQIGEPVENNNDAILALRRSMQIRITNIPFQQQTA